MALSYKFLRRAVIWSSQLHHLVESSGAVEPGEGYAAQFLANGWVTHRTPLPRELSCARRKGSASQRPRRDSGYRSPGARQFRREQAGADRKPGAPAGPDEPGDEDGRVARDPAGGYPKRAGDASARAPELPDCRDAYLVARDCMCGARRFGQRFLIEQ